MRFFLNLIYLLSILAAAPWLILSAIRFGKYRDGFTHKFFGAVPKRPADCRRVWFHAVSVGEVNLLRPMLDRLMRATEEVDIVISTTTKTGYELACHKYSEHCVFYCPLDFSWAVRNAFQRLAPTVLVLVELELWPNLLAEADRRSIPVAIVNGRLSDHSFAGYRRIAWLVRTWMSKIALVTAQSQTCGKRFVELGAPASRVHVVGSMKFDGAKTDRNNAMARRLASLVDITNSDPVLLAGSTQAPEERMVINVVKRLLPTFPTLRLILVPRHPERGDAVARLLQDSGLGWVRRTQISEPASRADVPPSRPTVVLVDTVGELGGWWGCADIGFVGGSMGKRGGQNMIEPAALGVATCFGPNTRNFRDVVRLLLAADAARVVPNEAGLFEFAEKCLIDGGFRRRMGESARQVVFSQAGAADQTLELLMKLISPDGVAFSHQGQPAVEAHTDEPQGAPLRRPA